ncbi:MAG TPA: hypothetical protein VH436_24555 [Vicinamibacterales bacterium]|jgi:hypothetical protein
MLRRVILSATLALIVGAIAGTAPVAAQWLKYPTAGIPRTADGKPDLKAPTPRTRDGKPDFSGMWLTADGPPCPQKTSGQDFIECGIELPISVLGFNMGVKIPGGLPYQPWAADLVKKRTAENSKDDPHARCLPDTFLRAYGLPHIQKFIQVPGLLVMLDEVNAGYRQVFTDGRPLPEDPVPAWNGYSTAKWDGDTLVIDSIGFRDDLWLDMAGSTISEKAKVRERIRRPDYGHLQIEATVDDPKVYTKPWTVTMNQQIVVDTELVDEICLENEKSSQRMK